MKLVPLVWKDGNIIISDEEKMNGTVQMNSSLKISNFFNQFFFSNILFFFVFFSVSVFFFFFFFFCSSNYCHQYCMSYTINKDSDRANTQFLYFNYWHKCR